jgi:hypothetical protein
MDLVDLGAKRTLLVMDPALVGSEIEATVAGSMTKEM